MKNILIVNDSLVHGGAEKAALSLANSFIEYGYNVDLIACIDEIHFDIPKNVTLHKLDFKKSFLDYTRYSLKLRKLIKAIKKNRNIVVTFFSKKISFAFLEKESLFFSFIKV